VSAARAGSSPAFGTIFQILCNPPKLANDLYPKDSWNRMENFMAKPGYQGLTRIIKAAGYSAKGFRAAWKYESAFRQEVVLTGALIPFAFWLGRDPVEIAMLVASLLLVLIVELLNSGIEAVVDRIGDEPHKLSGRAKDMGSAAVFVALILATVLWLAVIIDHLG
jgi:diacylglycerol kinase (ATP)